MALEQNIIELEPVDIKGDLLENFYHNLNVINQKGCIIKYPGRWFRAQGIPSPRQYIAWSKLIAMIGEKAFKDLPIEMAYVYDNEVSIVDKYSYLFTTAQECEVTIACGFFWKSKETCRFKMMDYFAEKMKENGWKITIYTQDDSLEKDFRLRHNICPDIYKVLYRIDLHYIIVKNTKSDKESHVFLELPHTEKVYYRFTTCFDFNKINDSFDCGKEKILEYLDWLRKPHLFSKSIPSKFNLAVNWRSNGK